MRNGRICAWLLVAFVAAGCAESNPAAERAATAATTPWLALMDAEDYERCWHDASSLFRDEEERESWVAKAKGYRDPLGEFESRELNTTRVITDPWGAPPGLYAVVVYDSVWQNGTIFEMVYMQQQDDESWRVAGYNVKQQR